MLDNKIFADPFNNNISSSEFRVPSLYYKLAKPKSNASISEGTVSVASYMSKAISTSMIVVSVLLYALLPVHKPLAQSGH